MYDACLSGYGVCGSDLTSSEVASTCERWRFKLVSGGATDPRAARERAPDPLRAVETVVSPGVTAPVLEVDGFFPEVPHAILEESR